jgi:hypothetical protein
VPTPTELAQDHEPLRRHALATRVQQLDEIAHVVREATHIRALVLL